MDIEYSLTEADILALMKYQLQRKTGRRNPVMVRRFAYVLGFALLALGVWLLLHTIGLAFVFVFFGIAAFLLYPVYFDWLMRRKVSDAYRDEQNCATLAKRTLRATVDGLEEISELAETRVKWDKVSDISSTPTHTFISLAGNAASMVIPKDRVSAGDYEVFINMCQRYRQGGAG